MSLRDEVESFMRGCFSLLDELMKRLEVNLAYPDLLYFKSRIHDVKHSGYWVLRRIVLEVEVEEVEGRV